MDNLSKVFAIVLFLFIGGWSLMYFQQQEKLHKTRQQLAVCNERIEAIVNAPIVRDTVRDTIRVRVPEIVYIKATDSVIDTVYTDIYRRWYRDSITGENATIRYDINVRGWLEDITFDYDVYTRTITQEKIIYRDRVERIEKKLSLTALMTAGVSGEMPEGWHTPISIGMTGTYKNLGAAYIYDARNDIHHAGVAIKIR